MTAQESRPGKAEAAPKSFSGDQHIVTDCSTDPSNLATMPANEWRAWADGYHTGVDHGRQAAERAENERCEAAHAEASAILRAASSCPIVDPRMVTATDAELRQLAADRERAGIARFRADHTRRYALGGVA